MMSLEEGRLTRGRGQGRTGKSPEHGRLDARLCITVPEAAAMLSLSRNFGYELVRQGKLPVVRFGKRLPIPTAALEKMLEEDVSRNLLRSE
jgi:excisionase family DNA binding protein